MSYKIVKSSIVIALLIGFLGCSSNLPLTKRIMEAPTAADSVLFLPQKNLIISVPSSNAPVGGILGALVMIGVDAARQDAANKKAAPILARLEGYDFRQVMREALTAGLGSVKSVTFSGQPALETDGSEAQEEKSYANSGSDAVLFVHASYYLEESSLIVTGSCRLYPKAERLQEFKPWKSGKPPKDGMSYIYKNAFVFRRKSITPDNIQEALKEGAESIARQIADDLDDTK